MDVNYSNFPSEFTQMDLVTMLTETEKPSLQALSRFSSSTVPAPAPLYLGNIGVEPSSYAPSNGALHDHMETATLRWNSLRGGVHASAAAVREMVFCVAAMQPVDMDPASVRPTPKRRNVRISKDPQSVAARHRRERIRERIRILQRLVPGGTKMDTASILEEAIHYLKFLKDQVQSLEQANAGINPNGAGAAEVVGFSLDDVNGRLSGGNCILWGMNL